VEFAFFWVFLSLLCYAAFYAGIYFFKPALKKKEILYIYFAASIGIYFVSRIAGAALAFSVFVMLASRIFIRNKYYVYPGLKALFLIGLLCFCFFYLPAADKIWNDLNKIFLKAINHMPAASSIAEVFKVAVFFRFLYPAFLAAGITIFFLYITESHRASFWQCFLIRFSHRQILALAVLWTLFGIFEISADFINWRIFSSFLFEVAVLNVCLYFSFFYIIYGFLIINHILKKRGFSVTITSLSVYSLLILSGGFVVYLLTLILGIGVSDVWMDYTKKKIKKSPA
jgi:hypothetical protein